MSGESAFGWLKVFLALVLVIVAGWLIYWLRNRYVATVDAAREVISDTVENLNPVNPGNVFYRAASDVVTGGADSLGGWFYSITHRDPVEVMKEHELERNNWPYGQPIGATGFDPYSP